MIPFKRPLIFLILQGKKTQTRRNTHYQYSVRKIYAIGDDWKAGPKSYILITRKWRQRLGDISPDEIKAEGFNSLEEMRSFWEHNIGRWQPDQTVIAYEFKLIAQRVLGDSRAPESRRVLGDL